MMPAVLVIIAFVMMALSDVLKLRTRTGAGKALFMVSLPVLLAGLLWSALGGARFSLPLPLRLVCLLLAAAGAYGEYVALFGALPAKATYLEAQPANQLVSHGLYALCRHPGALFLPLATISLALALGSRSLLLNSLLASALNLFYVWFQDKLVFPRMISGYHEYRQSVPFLFPTTQSIARAAATKNNKQDIV